MNDLLKCDVYWFWGPEQEVALAKVKNLISTAPVLAYFDPTKITVVSVNASSYGLGGVLLQYHSKELRPVAFAYFIPSRKGIRANRERVFSGSLVLRKVQ